MPEGYKMISFDVKTFFTNVALKETNDTQKYMVKIK